MAGKEVKRKHLLGGAAIANEIGTHSRLTELIDSVFMS